MAENKEKRLDYSVLSRRRNDLFGISIVSIVIFHFFLLNKSTVSGEYKALVGSVGVPVFLILSGMGLFFSMSRNANLAVFYKKRLVRVLTPYLIVSAVHFTARYIFIEPKGILAVLKGILFVDFITSGDSQFWFIALILVMYIVFPLLFKLFKSGKMNFLKLAVLCFAVIGVNILLRIIAPAFYKNTKVMLTRIPSFIIGVYIGEKVYNKREVQAPFWIITILVGAAFLALSIRRWVADIPAPNFMMIRYGETFYALLIMMIGAIVLDAVNSKKLSAICAFFGAMSLELYMVHVSLRTLMSKVDIPPSNPLYYLAMVAVAVFVCFFLQKFDSFATKKLTARKQ